MRFAPHLAGLPPVDPRRRAIASLLRLGENAQRILGATPTASDAVIVAGSGRSGTTWIAEVLAAARRSHLIFEPMNPVWIPEVQTLTGWDERRLHPRSHYLRPHESDRRWESFIDRALSGRVRAAWTDPVREHFLPNRYIVKFIRANMMLGWIHERFAPRIVYVLRDPRAVAASRLALGWTADVQDLLAQERLVEDHLRPWLAQIEREKDLLGAHAVCWAVENAVAHRQLAGKVHMRVDFEELLLGPEASFRDIFAWLGIDVPRDLSRRLVKPSSQSRRNTDNASSGQRPTSWKQYLSDSDADRIHAWASRMGVPLRDDSRATAFPSHASVDGPAPPSVTETR